MQNMLEIAHETSTCKKPVRVKQTICKRVREVLLALGGEAHRSIVIEQVARRMGHDVRQIPEELSAEVIVSFEETWRDERKRAAYGFHLPFGEGSHRWGVRIVEEERALAA
jgi:predicted transcriptional regulator